MNFGFALSLAPKIYEYSMNHIEVGGADVRRRGSREETGMREQREEEARAVTFLAGYPL
jgi:hypothetical protein